jgi:hypothetical protein
MLKGSLLDAPETRQTSRKRERRVDFYIERILKL